jgi:hypothetical protein
MNRPIPLLGDISLEYVQQIEHSLDAGFVSTRIPGLEGELQQRCGRSSHHVRIAGLLVGDNARDNLGTLQKAAQTGEELTFAADITSALDLQKVVIKAFNAREAAGNPGRIEYQIELIESPALPPPAETGGFGGLGGFGAGDLGFDPGILDDVASLADDVASAVDQATDTLGTLGALANLALSGGLDFQGIFDPLGSATENVKDIAGNFNKATQELKGLFLS